VLLSLKSLLIERFNAGHTIVLVVDEAFLHIGSASAAKLFAC
jgi:hypothetical protein